MMAFLGDVKLADPSHSYSKTDLSEHDGLHGHHKSVGTLCRALVEQIFDPATREGRVFVINFTNCASSASTT